jgi:hypothetical protein
LAGDIDKYITAAKKIPELPLEDVISKTAGAQTNLKDATLGVVTALLQQAKADDDPIHGLETMNTQLQNLIDKYKNFPAVKDVFVNALAESVMAEAKILASQTGLPAEIIASILNSPNRTEDFASLFGLSYDAPGRASGGPVFAGSMYRINEFGTEGFVPSMSGTVVPLSAGGGGSLVGEVHQHFYDPTNPRRQQLEAAQALRDQSFLLGMN